MSDPMALDDREEWTADAQDAIATLAATGNSFTADDLRWAMRPAPHPSMVGAAFQTARRRGLITESGTACSTTASRKHSLIRQWVGVAA